MTRKAISASETQPITRLLRDWRSGDDQALEALMPLVHRQLIQLARGHMAHERSATMQPTALVNEAFLRLVDSSVDFVDRSHFYAMTARMMRRILVDQARARSSQRRGGDKLQVSLEDNELPAGEGGEEQVDFLALDQALTTLAQRDEQKAEILVLTYFGGMTTREVAAVLDVSAMKVSRELRFARAWLAKTLGDTFNLS
ncbi:sigma-70 family RNA polymerase sigma factor [Wenzhouxiangella sp. AB-CW3]|uniref:ECF-type sigma factor n=1 Tax=Wenzhouxiangella sp. AB-CW3 TaxID=2771012 RepID=UPI00168AE03B|nr:ECF-type sigma factor [Wenzhouxiangella sp. AB-CW3]QOC22184.1 sigma-70 family RNA polymerase sigma factor [Wenzhouxiangella sp. AB-CW3]